MMLMTDKLSRAISGNKAETKVVVLIVDDEVRIVRFLRTSLSLAGYEVATAAGGEEALRLVESISPDVMLLDIVMSPLDGFQVLKRLRAISQLPVIAMSAHASAREEAIRLGANAFLRAGAVPVALLG